MFTSSSIFPIILMQEYYTLSFRNKMLPGLLIQILFGKSSISTPTRTPVNIVYPEVELFS